MEATKMLTDKKTIELEWRITDISRGNVKPEQIKTFVIVTAYMLKVNNKISTDNKKASYTETLDAIDNVGKNIRNKAVEFYNQMLWDNVIKIDADDQVLNDLILNESEEFDRSRLESSTPSSIAKLASKLLETKDGCIADLCSGQINFFKEYILNNRNSKSNKYYGYELNASIYVISKIKAIVLNELYGVDIDLTLTNVLAEDFASSTESLKFDRLFMDPPAGQRISMVGEVPSMYNSYGFKKPDLASWLYAFVGFSKLSESGEMAVVMEDASAYNMMSRTARMSIVDSRNVKAVIALPNSLYQTTSIPFIMYILTKKSCDQVKMIDATSLYKKGRRINIISDANVEKILSFMHKDVTGYTKTITVEEIKNNDYNLSPSAYVSPIELPTFDNEVRLAEIVDIVRGANLHANKLDAITTEKETNIQFLMLSDIKDGVIDNKLAYLKNTEPVDLRCQVENHDLIISKNGLPIKTAVAEIEKGKTVIANGNLYILKIKDGKANPYYLQSFLASRYGQVVLGRISKGSVIKNISLKDLREIKVPLPDMKVQDKIGQKYKALLDETIIYEMKKKEAMEKSNRLFEEEMKEDA